MDNRKLVMEPFKIKMVEPLHSTTPSERLEYLRNVGFNVFLLQSEHVYIDLLSDSGTGAMSQDQWSALLKGDEAYAGARGFSKMKRAVEDIFGFEHTIPCHQGRGAENILHSALVKPGSVVPGNMHFDTTKAHIEKNKGRPLDFVVDEAMDLFSSYPFKGNISLKKLELRLEENRKDRIPFVVVTVTCNSCGGQPVSLANLRAVKKLCKQFEIPVCGDAARIFENAYFIKEREEGMADYSIKEIVKMQSECFDMMTMSAKKDAIVNIGGFLALKKKEMYDLIAPYCLLYEGFTTYGGMSGRDMECLTVGLYEGMDEDFLRARIGQVRMMGERLRNIGIPVMWPPGGHAIYIDAKEVLPHINQEEFPGVAFGIHLYIRSGVRACEIGTLMNGRDPETGKNRPGKFELVRFAIPRRVYTNTQIEYVIHAIEDVWKNRNEIRGVTFIHESPILRHFTSTFRPM